MGWGDESRSENERKRCTKKVIQLWRTGPTKWTGANRAWGMIARRGKKGMNRCGHKAFKII